MNENGSLMGIWLKYKFAIHPKDCQADSYKLGFQQLAMAFVTVLAAYLLAMFLFVYERWWPVVPKTRQHEMRSGHNFSAKWKAVQRQTVAP